MARRYPHIAFRPECIQSFLDGRDILSCGLLSGGASNSNYRIQITGGDDFIVRLYNHGSAAHDRRILDLARRVVPVPEMVADGDGWAVFRFLPGGPLGTSPAAAEAAGRALARIGTIALPRSGQILEDGRIEPYGFGGLAGFVDTWLAKPEVQKWLGAETCRGVESLVAREAGRIAEIEESSQLVHGDFNPTNILAQGDEITGVIDWECAHSGSPYMDIGNLLRHLGPAAAEPVARGFRSEGVDLPADWQRRAALVDLTSHLEFLTSGMPDDFKRRCVERVESLLA